MSLLNGDTHNSLSLPLDFASLDEAEDEASWVQDLLAASTRDGASSLQTLEASLSRLLGQLELASSDEASNVDRIIDTVSRSVPRLTFDLQLMRENALLLRYTLDGLHSSSAIDLGGKSGVNEVMERLTRLDTIKSRMEAARDVLREAEAWSTLDGEVTSLVSDKSYTRAAERLAEASKSMAVFANTAEYEPRRALLLSLQNSLEAALSAPLVAAINGRDTKTCRSFFAIFAQIERESEFRQYYYASRRTALVDAWSGAVLVDGRNSAELVTDVEPVAFAAFLPRWYAQLFAALEDERSYLASIFPDPGATLAAFLQSTLDALSPSMSGRITDVVEHHGPHALHELIKLYHATEEFGVRIEAMHAQLSSTQPAATSQDATAEHADAAAIKRERRQSKRMSMSRRSSGRTPSFTGSFDFGRRDDASTLAGPTAWEVSLFEPFLDCQVDYPMLERSLLELDMPRLSVNAAAADLDVKVMLEAGASVFSMAEAAIGRSVALTHGYGSVGAVEASDRLISRFLTERKDAVLQISRSGANVGATGSARRMDLEGLDYSEGDWARFQLGLRLLETCRTMSERMAAFESKARTRLVGLAKTIRAATKDPLGFTVPGTPKGALVLLRQSTLNSADLSRLVDAIDPPSQGVAPLATLLPAARGSAISLTRASQSLLHDTVLRPLLLVLAPYASLPVWASATDPSATSQTFDLTIPTFSLSPTETISRLGEGLFNLPRLFEVYADDDALAFSIETLPFVDVDSMRAALAAVASATASAESPLDSPATVVATPRKVTPPTSAAAPQPLHLSAEAVVSTWLSSLTLSMLSHLTTNVLPSIRRLSARGSAQLGTDLAYLARVAQVLEAESDELDRWREAAEMDEAALKVRLGELDSEVYERVASLRGLR